ncbi:MAG: hypothetical protein GX804_11100 [Lentisphaerae bacterium]|jgi:hypothetical protein|nr:hypothetical protein [Lentisphaerota bacterium]
MKYTDRELKMFNFFALTLFFIGGAALILGIIDFSIMPEVSYYSQTRMDADPAIAAYSIEAVTNVGSTYSVPLADVSSDEEGEDFSESLETSADLTRKQQSRRLPRKSRYVYETTSYKETNLGALSKILTGVVFLLLSLALNKITSDVKRRGGFDHPGKRDD